MKTKHLLSAISLLLSISNFSQDNKTIINSVFKDSVYVLDNIQSLDSKKDTLKFNGYMLNSLFTSLVNDKAFGVNDLSTSKYYANLSNEDNSFSFGINFNTSESNLKKTTWIISTGFSLKSKSGFATVFKNGALQNEVYLTAKVGAIGNGVLTFYENDKTSYRDYYKNYLKDKYRNKMAKAMKEGGTIDDELKKLEAANDKKKNSDSLLLREVKEELISAIAEEEKEAMEEHRWYSSIRTYVWTAEAKIPVSINQFNVSVSNDSAKYSKEKQYLWKVSTQHSMMWKYRKKSKLFLTGKLSLENSNNAITEDLSKSNFLTFTPQSSTNQSVTDETSVFVGDFKRIVVGTAGVEAIFFPRDWIFGISGSIEQNFIGTDFTNWKIGIPLKLRDKDQKGVNLEVQFKEVNKVKLIGIKAGFVLGKFVR